MLKRNIRDLQLAFFLGWTLTAPLALAFDPTSLALAAATGGGDAGMVEEAADIGISLSDLLSDLDVPNEAEPQINAAMSRLNEMQGKARDLKWNSEDIRNAIDNDLKGASSISGKIRALREMTAASKRIAEIAGVRPRAAQKAVSIQEIKINSMILEELQSLRRAQFLAYLESSQAKTQRELMLSEINDKERTHSYLGGRP